MTEKFGRNYRITIDPKDGLPPIVITLPFTLEFWLQRNTLSYLNHLSIDIYNLGETNRQRIFQDRFDLGTSIDPKTGNIKLDANGQPVGVKTIIFELGYSTLYKVFNGTVFNASSAREGINIITRIECQEGLWDVASCQVFTTLQAGQTLGQIIKYLVDQFPTLKPGAIGSFPTVINRPVILNGNTYKLLKQYSADSVFISSGKIFVLQNNEVLDTQISLINDASGLLQTPRRDGATLWLTTLLESGIDIKQQVRFESSIQKEFNGTYQVIGINHQGKISAAVSGECRSLFQLLAPEIFPSIVKVKAT